MYELQLVKAKVVKSKVVITVCVDMKHVYPPGAAKRRKTKEKQIEISKLPKISSYLSSSHEISLKAEVNNENMPKSNLASDQAGCSYHSDSSVLVYTDTYTLTKSFLIVTKLFIIKTILIEIIFFSR